MHRRCEAPMARAGWLPSGVSIEMRKRRLTGEEAGSALGHGRQRASLETITFVIWVYFSSSKA